MSNSESKHARIVELEALVLNQAMVHALVLKEAASKIAELRDKVKGSKKMQKAAEVQRDAARHTLKCIQG